MPTLTGASQVFQGAGGTGAAAILPGYDPAAIITRDEDKLLRAQEEVAKQRNKTLADIKDKLDVQLQGWADKDFDELIQDRENFIDEGASLYAEYRGFPPANKVRELENRKKKLENRMLQSEDHHH